MFDNLNFKKQMEYRINFNIILDDLKDIIDSLDTKPVDEDVITSSTVAFRIMYTLNPSDLEMMKQYRKFIFKYPLKRDVWLKLRKSKVLWNNKELYEGFSEKCKK